MIWLIVANIWNYLRTVYSRKEWAAAWHPWTIARAQAARSLRVSARKWCVTTPSIVPTRTANVAPCWVEPLLLLAASFCLVGEETNLKHHPIRVVFKFPDFFYERGTRWTRTYQPLKLNTKLCGSHSTCIHVRCGSYTRSIPSF